MSRVLMRQLLVQLLVVGLTDPLLQHG